MWQLEQCKRTTHSYFGNKLKDALQKEHYWFQAEKLPAFLPYFVREDLLEQIHNNTNHLIVGRRGSGKTHFLGAFEELINNNKDSCELVVRLSCSTFSITPLEMLDKPLEYTQGKYTRLIFQAFLRQFINQLIINIHLYTTNKLEMKTGNKKQLKEIKRQSDNKLLNLLELVEFGAIHPLEGTSTITTTDTRTKLKDIDTGIGVGVHINKYNPSLSLLGNVGYKENISNLEGESHVAQIISTMTLDLNRIRGILIELIDLLEVDTLYLLLDEWMELDKNLNLHIQPYFAQLLKILMFNHNKFSVKIASVWHYTHFYDRNILSKSRGIELGEDISLGIDLDESLTEDKESVIDFFKCMLFKRLVTAVDGLSDFKKGNCIDNAFIIELFNTLENFTIFIAASHGIPRDFLELCNKCSLLIRRDFAKYCISKELIREVARSVYLIEKRSLLEKTSSGQQLLQYTNEYLGKVGSRLFLVKNQEAEISEALKKLVDEELVHPIPSALAPRLVRENFKMFYIDYGNYIDWYLDTLKYKKEPIEVTIEETFRPEFTDNFIDTYGKYVLSLFGIGHDTIVCPHCRNSFNISNPVYRKLSCCPLCAENILLDPK